MPSTNPAASPKLKRLWASVVLAAMVILCAPLVGTFAGLPFVGLRAAVISGAITFITMVPVFWVALDYLRDRSTRRHLTRR